MDYPDVEQKAMGCAACGRAVFAFQYLLDKAGIDQNLMYYTTMTACSPDTEPLKKKAFHVCKTRLWEEMKEVKPKLILTMGKIPSVTILNFKKSTKLGDMAGGMFYVGYAKARVLPWYSMQSLLNQGAKAEKKTLAWLTKVKKELSNG